MVGAGCGLGAEDTELASTGASEVIARARLGNNTEDVTRIDRGPLANTVIAVDGGEVIAMARHAAPRTLFVATGLGNLLPPRGVAFLPREQELVFDDPAQTDRLFLTDLDGRLAEVLPLDYPAAPPDHVEALVALPPSSPQFPGHLVMVSWRFGARLEADLEVIARDGRVVAEIEIDPAIAGRGITALAFDRDHFLVSPVNDEIWSIGFDGAVLDGPVLLDELTSIEGLAAVPGGFVAAGYGDGKLVGLDRHLDRRPNLDRDYRIGHGFTRMAGIAGGAGGALWVGARYDRTRIATLSLDLEDLEVVGDFAGNGDTILGGLTVLDGEDRVAAAHVFAPNAVLVFDAAGEIVESLDFDFPPPLEIAFVEQTDELLALFPFDPPGMIRVLGRDGAEHRRIDLAPAGSPALVSIEVDESGPDPVIVGLDGAGTVYEIDLDGAVLRTVDYRDLLGDAFIPGGVALVGSSALAFFDTETNEVVISERR